MTRQVGPASWNEQIARADNLGIRLGTVNNLRFAFSLVSIAWLVQVFNVFLDYQLNAFGIRPGQPIGLIGILTAPFLHSDWEHLIANTVPALILITMVCWSGRRVFWTSSMIIMVVAGVGTWLMGGAGTSHIGTSAMVYGWVAFLITRGLFARSFSQILIGVVVLVLYGSLWVGIIPTSQDISWQGHLSGAIGGLIAAWVLPRTPRIGRTALAAGTMT